MLKDLRTRMIAKKSETRYFAPNSALRAALLHEQQLKTANNLNRETQGMLLIQLNNAFQSNILALAFA